MNFSGINIPKKVDENTFSSRKKYKISLIVSEWNNQITSKLLEGAVKTLTHNCILNENIFIRSNNNSLILLNIDTLPINFQKKLLFFLENKVFF